MIELLPGVFIDEGEIRFHASRASGPGGQNVNKVASRVMIFFDVEGCAGLSPEQKARVRVRLATRLSRAGVLRVVSQRHRSQAANRQEALIRLVALLRQALREEAERIPTQPSPAAKERRLSYKHRHSARKKTRRAAWEEL